jgi:hypothetical protein
MADNITVNYDDERFGQVEADKNKAMTELTQTYDGMINSTDGYYQAQIDASKQWADTQTKLQQEQTDFAIEQVEQQKDQAHKDYLKEQSGSYVDWQKQSNQYGANAEAKASQGMQNTGFSESSQVAMYTAYQNRVAVARDSYNRAVLNYDNAIKDARLQNNAALAEIAMTALQQQLELSLQGFQYKNQLVLDKANQKINLDNQYYNRYLDVLNQINTENAMAEQIRQFNMEYNEGIRQFNEEIARLKKKDEQEAKMQIEELELKKKQLAEERRQFDEQMAYTKSKSSGGGGGGGGTPSYTPTKDDTPDDEPKPKVNPTKDNRSQLGLGPINDKTLAGLISSGRVTYTQSGDTVNYKWSAKNKKEQQLLAAQGVLDKYTMRY